MSSAFTESPTPLLDLESPLPKFRQWDRLSWRQAVVIVVLPLVAVILLVPTFLVLSDNNPTLAKIFKYIGTKADVLFKGAGAQSPLLFFLFYFLTLFLVLLIHELGHVAAGLAVGFHFQGVRIGPLTLAKSPKGLKITFQRISNLDGIAAMGIQKLRRLRSKLAIYIAAGPLANILSGLCLWLFLTSQILSKPQLAIRQSLEFFAALSIFVGVVNLIPFRRPNGMFTDGSRLLSFVASKMRTRRWLCILALKMQTESGVRLRNLKRTWIAHSCAISDHSLDSLQAFWTAYLVKNDSEEPQAAAQHLEKCLELFGIASPEFKKLLLMEAAIFHAWFRDDERKAKIWSQKSESSPPAALLSQLRLAICMHWSGRRYDELTSAWETGRVYIENLPPSTGKNRLKDAWTGWKNEIDKKRVAREALTNPQQVLD